MRLTVLTLPFALLGCVTFADEPDVETIYVTFIAPSSIEKMAAEADLIVRGKVLGSQAVAGTGKRPAVYTEHRFRVAETIAGWVPADSQQKHDEMLVLQHAGEVERDGARVKIADEVPLSPGAEYVLFLTWNPGYERFELSRGPYAIFKVENGAVHPASDYRTVKGAKGKAVRRFADELRRK